MVNVKNKWLERRIFLMDDHPITNISGVYKITNIKTGKVYIGISNDIERRKHDHFESLKHNRHHSSKLQRSYNLSKDKSIFIFELIEEINDLSQLKIREQYYIDLYDAFNTGYNCSEKVDNPKYALKNVNKAKRKQELNLLYNEFNELYNEDRILLGSTFKSRLEIKHYKKPTLVEMITAMKWFYDTYGKNDTKLYIRYCFGECILTIADDKDNHFAVYYIKHNEILWDRERTGYRMDDLMKNGLYDEIKHRLLY
jgi:group I intron endonuclease